MASFLQRNICNKIYTQKIKKKKSPNVQKKKNPKNEEVLEVGDPFLLIQIVEIMIFLFCSSSKNLVYHYE